MKLVIIACFLCLTEVFPVEATKKTASKKILISEVPPTAETVSKPSPASATSPAATPTASPATSPAASPTSKTPTASTPTTPNNKKRTKLDRQLSTLRKDVAKTDRDEALQEMFKELKEINEQRARLRMFVGGYTIAHLILMLAKYVSLINPYFIAGVQGVNYLKEWMINPLDERYMEHQRHYANAVAHFLNKYPEYRKGYKTLPKTLKIKTNDGEEIYLKVLKEKEEEDLPESSLHLNNKGPVELVSTVLQMKR